MEHKDKSRQAWQRATTTLPCTATSLCSFFLLFLLLHLFSCSGKRNKSRHDTSDTLALRMAVLPTVDCLPFYYAAEEGIFDSLGLHLRLQTFAAAMDADTAFRNRRADIIATDLVKACTWKAGGDSIGIIMSGELKLYLMTAYSARIRQTSSLREKIIGITRHSAVDLFTDMMLESAKFISTDLNKPQINNLYLRCQMVDQNQYDGAVLPEPFASESEARGARRIYSTDDLGLNLSAVVVHDSIRKTHTKDIALLRKGYDIAVGRINQTISAYAEALSDTLRKAPPTAPPFMKYFPQDMTIEIPDSLVQYRPMQQSSLPTDTTLSLVIKWCNGRQLLKTEITTKDLIPQKQK